MPLTIHQVRAALYPEEPDYKRASRLGPEALVYLENILGEGDPMLAPKATYLASLIRGTRSVAVVSQAARSERPSLRVAAAAAARNLSEPSASGILVSLLNDKDVGVRKTALNSVSVKPTSELRKKIQSLGNSDQDRAIRVLSNQVIERLQQKHRKRKAARH